MDPKRRVSHERGGGEGSLTAFDVKLHISSVQCYATGSDVQILLVNESVQCTSCIIYSELVQCLSQMGFTCKSPATGRRGLI